MVSLIHEPAMDQMRKPATEVHDQNCEGMQEKCNSTSAQLRIRETKFAGSNVIIQTVQLDGAKKVKALHHKILYI